MSQIKDHWNRRLILPLELADALSPVEYAALIENLPTDYLFKFKQSRLDTTHKKLLPLMYWVMLEWIRPRANNLSGSDLSTFEVKGRTGKAGIEKEFDEILRGIDGRYLASQSAWLQI